MKRNKLFLTQTNINKKFYNNYYKIIFVSKTTVK